MQEFVEKMENSCKLKPHSDDDSDCVIEFFAKRRTEICAVTYDCCCCCCHQVNMFNVVTIMLVLQNYNVTATTKTLITEENSLSLVQNLHITVSTKCQQRFDIFR